MILRTDGEPAVRALARLVYQRREHDTVTETGSRDDSKAIGGAERANRTLGNVCRTLRSSTEQSLRITIPLDHPIIAWLVRHAAWTWNQFGMGRDGQTPYM